MYNLIFKIVFSLKKYLINFFKNFFKNFNVQVLKINKKSYKYIFK